MNLTFIFILSGVIRYSLSVSKYSSLIQHSIEVSTPLNSLKRVLEGVHLYDNNVDPYSGDIVHETPQMLLLYYFLVKYMKSLIPLIHIIVDLLTGLLLHLAAKNLIKKFINKEKQIPAERRNKQIQLQDEDVESIPIYCLITYLFNPFTILNAVGQTSTVFSNFFLALTIFGASKRLKLLSMISLALETQKNFYPVIYIIPVSLMLISDGKSKVKSLLVDMMLFASILVGCQYVNHALMGSWNFAESTYAFIMSCNDLTPSIGIFWYFFTEMFDHFRELFLYTFQFNTTILYLLPLTLIFKDEPEFLFTILLSLTTIFRSYPCVGDICFYLALIPLWRRFSCFMAHNFVVISTFIITSILGPVVYYLWIYENSANANFFFGVTLVFCTANIFLVTDLIFSSLKRKFCVEEGTIFGIDMKLLLE